MIHLYDYWRSSAAYRLRITLGLAGLDWEATQINLAEGDQRSPEHLARNPQALVPVLEIDGQRMVQSLAIIEYLDATRALGLIPEDPLQAARVRAAAYVIAMDIHPVCNLRVASFAAQNSNGGITMESWMQAHIGPGLAAFETMLDDGERCFGDAVTMADICLMPQLYNAHRWGIDLSPVPKIRRIEATLSEIPAFAAAHPDQTPH
ncbi:maleylacetoacetate isomerase [Ponticoccus sp. SC2-23]|uniref:maleylacetoacetate isomerase n=1 Tax=Alexandriicola marinus TaxID=2081710 RepID=UPI000FD8F0A2|nr:maleylacetoacetate isomerase [Alexandriicola marinus]MBM1220435.1 maleylacetoacetate isomerase [Ponticoccus sp. SC6-9]MBM1225121.1 maleylacetoacetate isomerase [Ponticoccus sp. SC6-15]MBM1228635.1 maleylacetoacetate isomerase [Ponticoccus sp. SC6-38]MBM1233728.1 maleylacetoacetate isomerase [Ponticoccus sp. SC6-45]MBM1239136.1 maleylacetoacetate isomerase [Ponticoccus sp. SC6-49]MBM1242918.1 maleylacetoacetate isomerase [Ponticoccus sp. SC2-64]MBM1247252.1 maleylacetoacetate isomerase [Po